MEKKLSSRYAQFPAKLIAISEQLQDIAYAFDQIVYLHDGHRRDIADFEYDEPSALPPHAPFALPAAPTECETCDVLLIKQACADAWCVLADEAQQAANDAMLHAAKMRKDFGSKRRLGPAADEVGSISELKEKPAGGTPGLYKDSIIIVVATERRTFLEVTEHYNF